MQKMTDRDENIVTAGGSMSFLCRLLGLVSSTGVGSEHLEIMVCGALNALF